MPTGHETSPTGCVQHEPPHDQRREAGRIPGRGSVMGSGMASHTAWRAWVTGGGGWSGRERGQEGTQEPGPRAAPGTFSTQQSHRRIHVEPSVGTARCSPTETGTSPRDLVGDAAGFRHQLSPKEEPLSRPGNTAGPHVQMPKTNPHAGPGQRPVEGCPQPTHLALVSSSYPAPRPPLTLPPLDPGTSPGGYLSPCPACSQGRPGASPPAPYLPQRPLLGPHHSADPQP